MQKIRHAESTLAQVCYIERTCHHMTSRIPNITAYAIRFTYQVNELVKTSEQVVDLKLERLTDCKIPGSLQEDLIKISRISNEVFRRVPLDQALELSNLHIESVMIVPCRHCKDME
jgi:hypothetical protein